MNKYYAVAVWSPVMKQMFLLPGLYTDKQSAYDIQQGHTNSRVVEVFIHSTKEPV